MAKDPAKLTEVSVSLPFGLGKAKWETDPTERRAAWSLYVELVTRIAVQRIELDHGSLRETLNSLYSLFASTREVLKESGPDVGASRRSVGGIAIAVLNRGLRPFLSEWHPLLQSWEAQRLPNVAPRDHERSWHEDRRIREALDSLRGELERYADALARIAGVST